MHRPVGPVRSTRVQEQEKEKHEQEQEHGQRGGEGAADGGRGTTHVAQLAATPPLPLTLHESSIVSKSSLKRRTSRPCLASRLSSRR